MEKIKIYLNKSNVKIVLTTFIAINIFLILLIVLELATNMFKYLSIPETIIIVLNASIIVRIFFRYKNNIPFITFNNNGIRMLNILNKKSFLKWNDIIETQNIILKKIPMIALKINNDSKFIKNRSLLGLLILKFNQKKIGYELTFSYMLLDYKFDIINDYIKKHISP